MKIVKKITDDIDVKDVLCTTYQMRNFYTQLGGAFFSNLDIMNYIQHHQIVKWCKPGMDILDVCCGRGLLLPMLRYQVKNLGSYTGVDIEPKNAIFTSKRVTDNKQIEDDYYPFPVNFVHSNVSEMSNKINQKFDMIIYTSSIEHMHKEHGKQSLFECAKLSKENTKLIITCPNTPEDKSGYDTQYAAHVYEWKRSELITELNNAGFRILDEWGLLVDKQIIKNNLGEMFERLNKFIPSEWLIPMLSPLYPEQSKEIGFICEYQQNNLFTLLGV